MPTCENKEPRESLRGAGPCEIEYEVMKRNGQPNWWCHTHGMDASAPDGNRLEACPGSWFEPVPAELRLDVDLTKGQVAVWGVVPPVIQIGRAMVEPGKVHVHHRHVRDGPKDIDASFDLVRLHMGTKTLLVEGMAAVAYALSELSGREVTTLKCRHCHQIHIDELKFATFPHRKHLCNSCGRNFIDTAGPSISNPLAHAHQLLGLPPAPAPEHHDRPLCLNTATCSTVVVWPSNRAIVSTMSRPEEIGFHVHAWDHDGKQVIDDTYSSLVIDGADIDEVNLRVLAVQRALAHGAPIRSLPCSHCGASLTGRRDGWMEPTTAHTCTSCGGVTRTRRKVFVNPLASKES